MSRRREAEWDWDRPRLTVDDLLLAVCVLLVIGVCLIVPAVGVGR